MRTNLKLLKILLQAAAAIFIALLTLLAIAIYGPGLILILVAYLF